MFNFFLNEISWIIGIVDEDEWLSIYKLTSVLISEVLLSIYENACQIS